MKDKITEIPEKAGFYTGNNGYRFIAYTDDGYETKAVKQAKFETAEISHHDIECQVIRYAIQNHRILNMLMILDISSLL